MATHLTQRGFEVFLPLVPEERQWHDRTRTVEFPMFPGYLFARFSMDDLYRVMDAPGVANVVSFRDEPAPISEEEIENIRRFAAAIAGSGARPERGPIVRFEEGQEVRVVKGPFRDVRGVVVERRGADRALLQVGVRTIGQGLKIEVDVGALKQVES